MAARIDAIINPRAPGSQQQPARKTKGVFGIAERRFVDVALRDHGGHDQANERPPHRAHALDHVAVEHADPAGPFVAAGADGRELVRLRHDADQPVDRQHRDGPRTDAGRRRQREAERLERGLHASQAAHHAPSQRNEHEGEHDDQHPLEEIGPGRSDKAADEAIEDEENRHGHDDLIHVDAPARRLADYLAGALEHASGVDHEIAHGKDDVDRGHPRPVAILGEFSHRRPADAPEDGRHQPVERCDEQVLPLVPDGGRARSVDGARKRDRHLGVCANAEALPDHQPGPEAALT